MAYFAGVTGAGTTSNETGHDYNPIRSWICEGNPGWSSWYNTNNGSDKCGKGTEYGCMSSWKVSDAVSNGHPNTFMNVGRNGVPGNYSWAVIMYGTNDVDGWGAGSLQADSQAWKTNYKNFVQAVMDEGCIPVLSTIPPEHDHVGDQRYTIANDRIKEICSELNIPYIDYYQYILDKQPGTSWDGAAIGEDRLISTDGTHPSNVGGSNNFSQTALTFNNGFAARTKLTLDMAEKIKEIIFDNGPAEVGGVLTVTTNSLPDGFVGEPYSQSVQASGGVPPYSWSVVSGSLAPLTLSSGGVISGTPASATTLNFTVRVTDQDSDTDDQPLSITITASGPPQITTLTSVADTSIYQGAPNDNYGGDQWANIIRGGWVGNEQYMLYRFDLTSIPVGSTIVSATFRFHDRDPDPNEVNGTFYACRILSKTWVEGTGSVGSPTTDGATWSQAAPGIPWNGAGGQFQVGTDCVGTGSADGVYTGYVGGGSPGYISMTVTGLVQEWVGSSQPNYGLAVIAIPSGSSPDALRIQTSSRETGSNPPQLEITYQAGAPDSDPPTVTVSSAVLAGNVSDAPEAAPPKIIVGGTEVDVSSGNWTSPDIAVSSGDNDILIECTDASSNTRQVNVRITLP